MPFNNYKTANNASGTPVGALSAGSTTLILTTGQGARFPITYPYLLTIEERQSVSPFAVTKREIVKVTNRVSDTFTIVRSAGTCLPDDSSNTPGTTAFSFNTPAQTSVNLAVSSEVTDDMQAEIARLETAKVNKAGDTLTGLLQGAKSTNIASATTTDLATANGNFVHITGTTTITSFGTVTAGTQMTLVFDGILTLTHNATSLILPGGANITTAVGDSAIFESEGSGNWKCVSYTKANGNPVTVSALTGSIVLWSTNSIPPGYLLCDGSAVSRSTYSALFSVLSTTYGIGDGSTTFNLPNLGGRIPVGKQSAVSKGTATITIASPGVVTLASHGLANGQKVYFTTTGALPTGLSINIDYYVVNADANTFQLATTLGGTAINTSGTQSGTHTLFSSDFNTLGGIGGEVSHKLTQNEMPSHTHPVAYNGTGPGTEYGGTVNTSVGVYSQSTFPTKYTGGDKEHLNIQPYITLNYIIKT